MTDKRFGRDSAILLEGETGLSKKLTDRILMLEDGEHLLRMLQEQYAKFKNLPQELSEESLSSLDDGELGLYIRKAREIDEIKEFDKELMERTMNVIQNYTDEGTQSKENQLEDEIQTKIKKFNTYLRMLEDLVKRPGSTIADQQSGMVEKKIIKLREEDGIDMFKHVPNLQEIIDGLRKKGAENTLQAYLSYCRLVERTGDMIALKDWYDGAIDTVERNKGNISPADIEEAQVELRRIREILKPSSKELRSVTSDKSN